MAENKVNKYNDKWDKLKYLLSITKNKLDHIESKIINNKKRCTKRRLTKYNKIYFKNRNKLLYKKLYNLKINSANIKNNLESKIYKCHKYLNHKNIIYDNSLNIFNNEKKNMDAIDEYYKEALEDKKNTDRILFYAETHYKNCISKVNDAIIALNRFKN
jgi:hypothetical protein